MYRTVAEVSTLDLFSESRRDALHVVTILPTLNAYGGVVSVMNLLQHLTALGNRTTLASLSGRMRDALHAPFEPMCVPDREALPRSTG